MKLDESIAAGSPELTLAGVFDRTVTAMGGRLLRRWLHRPLRDRDVLRARYHAVATLIDQAQRAPTAESLRAIGDLERILARIALRSARPRDLAQLRAALGALPALRRVIAAADSPRLQQLSASISTATTRSTRVARARHCRGASSLLEGRRGHLPGGYDEELDELRALGSNTEQFLVELERRERERSGLSRKLEIGLQPGAGVFHRGEPQPGRGGPSRLPAQADRQVGGAIYHAGIEILRGQGARRARSRAGAASENFRRLAGAARREPAGVAGNHGCGCRIRCLELLRRAVR